MKITIHRGTHQIGGCVTEISSGNDKVFIDFGADLPGTVCDTPKPVAGLTYPDGSNSALFFTHYHGDHIGRLGEVRDEMPVLMGETAKAIYQNYVERTQPELLFKASQVSTFGPLETIYVGGITVTPLMVDHSAFDSYMFVIEADGRRVLHTGDFRLHGFRGGRTLDMLRRYATDIDCIICETTNLFRSDTPVMTERELQMHAQKIMEDNKYVFVLCSSTNIDRIGAFYHAGPAGRLFICDEYQKSQLEIVSGRHSRHSSFYDFSHVYSYAPNLDSLMERKGFCMIIRQGNMFTKLLERYKGRSRVIYSMRSGYLKGDTRNKQLADFLHDYDLTFLHTSGHASAQDIAALYHAVNPKTGIIPIHGEAPEQMTKLLPNGRVIVLDDGKSLELYGGKLWAIFQENQLN